jgi:hypothetical protein
MDSEDEHLKQVFLGYIIKYMTISFVFLPVLHTNEIFKGFYMFIIMVPVCLIAGFKYELLKYLYKEMK